LDTKVSFKSQVVLVVRIGTHESINLAVLKRMIQMIKVIKNEKEHKSALAEISALIDRDPDPGTPELIDLSS